MKHFLALLFVLLITSCFGNKAVFENPPKQTEEIAIIEDVIEIIETPSIAEPPQPPKDNATKISLGEDGTLTDDGISITTEIIYDEAFDHSSFNDLLKKHVSLYGNVDYSSFKSDSKVLQSYITLLKTYQPNDTWSKSDKLAYWINSYNALTIDLILRNYPTESIKDIKDPWDQRLWKFGDKWQNLNDIEHEILRKMNEPRIHFAIVCASISCPKLQNKAFTASNLEEQLTNATKEFITDKTKNELSKDYIKLSKIFKWFKKDFEQNGSLIDFLNQYADISISSKAKKSFMDYNWDLND
ncbi:DUF547 domain-containing protein [Winogradskyella sp. UBA3174]|uniref:DUF547 domain-containing protein n=1 Tax=Winogradskyella sp. UBA3174 TaxID=1947785 RepID=UPI0025DEB07C|nr:DUF547 domain-containing protein [Winogradskyella sp. UBA3174]|tara:strand:+ start:14985 stop:15881 length:897 start_codon:yes stop_codon:yes gene_type:complete